MNTPSPLVPQGTIPARGKSTVFFKVLMILTVHVVLIGGMLLQGCKDTKDNNPAIQPATDTASTTPATNSDTLPPVTTPGNVSNAVVPPPAQQSPVAVQTTSAPVPTPLAPVQAVQVAPPVAPPVAPVGEGKEYTIASRDTLGALAHKNGISLKALLEANPGINPKKLKVGQKIQIPAGGSTAGAGAGGAPEAAGAGDGSTYTVKSGDTLGKIAKMNHTTYKKIMALNDLKSTSIKVGQKLKMPAGKEPAAAPAEQAPLAAPVVPSQTAPVAPTAATTAPSTTVSN